MKYISVTNEIKLCFIKNKYYCSSWVICVNMVIRIFKGAEQNEK